MKFLLRLVSANFFARALRHRSWKWLTLAGVLVVLRRADRRKTVSASNRNGKAL